MSNILITFGGEAYDSITAHVVARSRTIGADQVWVYDDRWLVGTEFFSRPDFQYLYNFVGHLCPRGRGFGLYSWKPYIIKHALSRLKNGDMVLYLDADTYPIEDFSVLFRECERIGGHMAFMATAKTEPLCNRQWCKRDCFVCMGCDEPRYWHGPHYVARFIVMQKGASGITDFLDEWQAHCLDRHCQTFEKSLMAPEHDGPYGDGPAAAFREHRTEQAIYSNLCIKYGRKPYREACEFGKDCPQDWELYPQLFSQVGTHGPKSLAGSRFRNID